MGKSRMVKMSKVPEEAVRQLYEVTSERFFEKPPSATTNDNEYIRTPGVDQGLVLIFNQVKFNSLDERLGSDQDVNNIVRTLSKLGYNICVSDHVCNDYGRQEILGKKDKLEKEGKLQKSNCLIVIFLSHGSNNNQLYTNRGEVQVDEIIENFSSWDRFAGLPKLFIFQACKGDSNSTAPSRGKPFTVSTVLPPDIVVYFSSVEDKVSHRNTITGTWLIEELCNILLMYGKKEDVLNLLHRTSKCVASLANGSEETKQVTKQMPVVMSTLSKMFYLTNSKEKINNDAMIAYFRQHKSDIDMFQQQIDNILLKVD